MCIVPTGYKWGVVMSLHPAAWKVSLSDYSASIFALVGNGHCRPGLKQPTRLFHSLEAEVRDPVLEGWFLVCRQCLLAVSSHGLCCVCAQRALMSAPLLGRTLVLLDQPPPCDFNSFLRAPSPDTVILGVGASVWGFGRKQLRF